MNEDDEATLGMRTRVGVFSPTMVVRREQLSRQRGETTVRKGERMHANIYTCTV